MCVDYSVDNVDNVENVDKEKSINYVKLEKWRI